MPCVELDGLTDAEKRAYILADNKLAEKSGWDLDQLKLEAVDLNDLHMDLTLAGFDDDELAKLLEPDDEGALDEEEPPEPPAEPVTQPGDVWTMGDHRLVCGDSTSARDMALLMQGEAADLYLTDPPYNVSYEGGTKDALTIANDSMTPEEFRKFLTGAFKTAGEVLNSGASFYIWHASRESVNFIETVQENLGEVRETLIWAKNQLVPGRQDYQWRHEPCLYGWKDGGPHKWYSDRSQTTVLEFDKPQRNGEHPTMKPVELFAYQIKNSSKRGDIVLDSFGGSGTTLIACEQLGRKARLMELDPKYCDVIVRRWEKASGGQAVRQDSVKFDSIAP
ncbi:MAG: DNA modification methylase [Succinivibrio sp.]|nr:DNA modification methylase [Succinivibrio sp.]